MFELMVQTCSSPSFQVCDSEAVRGVESNTSVPHHAAQQRPQLRGDPVQRDLRGHVVHFTSSEDSVEDTATIHGKSIDVINQ